MTFKTPSLLLRNKPVQHSCLYFFQNLNEECVKGYDFMSHQRTERKYDHPNICKSEMRRCLISPKYEHFIKAMDTCILKMVDLKEQGCLTRFILVNFVIFQQRAIFFRKNSYSCMLLLKEYVKAYFLKCK